jgi:hypothetical protein
MADVLKQHIERFPDHPLSAAKAVIADLLAAAQNAIDSAVTDDDYCAICAGDVDGRFGGHASGCAIAVLRAAIKRAERR